MSRKAWTKPTITLHQSGAMNKFGAIRYENFVSQIDGVPVSHLIDEYGSPLFVISERRLRDNIRNARRAFTTRYADVIQGWSYKTNYLGVVCSIMHQEGAYAEVVSNFEYEKARALGVPGSKIIFNGPHKPKPILERAAKEGARIHIDHLDELFCLEEIAESLGKTIPVTIRLNFETGYTEPWSRFGFNIEAGQAMDAARRIAASKRLELTGLHSHIGTFVLEPRAYEAEVRILIGFMDAVESTTGCEIESLDIGGGFASRNALRGIYLPPEQVVPSIDQYAELITNTLTSLTHERAQKGRPRPTLILETGRALVDDAEVLITSVVANKRLPDGRRGTVIDAGANLLFTAFWYDHDLRATRPLTGIPEETVIYGPLCMNIDVVRPSIKLPPLTVGEPLVLSPAGAYNNTQWMQFIEYRPNVVIVLESGEVALVREAENLEVVCRQERLPERFRDPFQKREKTR